MRVRVMVGFGESMVRVRVMVGFGESKGDGGVW